MLPRRHHPHRRRYRSHRHNHQKHRRKQRCRGGRSIAPIASAATVRVVAPRFEWIRVLPSHAKRPPLQQYCASTSCHRGFQRAADRFITPA